MICKGKVYVGMSGGVDSAVSAALLKKAGYDVTGVFIRVWQPDWMECNWREERLEAMRAAAHIDIPFVTLDLEREYKEGVIDNMIDEYRRGRTPNPDVMCNRQVKFGAFWQWAKSRGADYIATGHYAQVGPGGTLLCGKDDNKDQSYFLWTLTRADLEHVIFPVGNIAKPHVRKLARKFGLPNADKKDSQGLCFIGKVDVKKFLEHYISAKAGDVLDETGNVIGTHAGATFLTIGERHGFQITRKTDSDRPVFVIAKDIERNTITVAEKSDDAIGSGAVTTAEIRNVSWVSEVPAIGSKLMARSRYRAELYSCRVERMDGTTTRVVFDVPQDTLTPGQSLVIYSGNKCLGGGILV